jgi:raffinose/stachyose/melibiose transport system substrate-binding protein
MMSYKLRALFVLVSTGVLAAALTGCAGDGASDDSASGSGKANIVYVVPNSWANTGTFRENLTKWEQKTGNTVEVQAVPDEKYDSTVQARLAGGEGIDLFAGQDNVADPASIMLEISGQAFEKRMYPDAFEAIKAKDGKVYGFPTADGRATFGVFYNKDVFTAAGIKTPTTLAELTSGFQAIKAKGVTPLFLAGKDGWTLLQHRNAVNALMFKSDPQVATKLATNTLTWPQAPVVADSYQALAQWADEGLINTGALSATYEQSQKALVEGKAGAIINGSWVISELRKLNPTANLGFFALPGTTADQQIGVGRVNIIHIAKSSKVADQAKDLLGFMVEKEQAEAFLAKAPGIPTFTDVKPAGTEALLADIQVYLDGAKTGPAFDNAARFPTPEAEIIAAYQELIAKKITAQQFLTTVDKLWKNAGKTAGLTGF